MDYRRSHSSVEGRLVLFDREHGLAAQGVDPLQKVGLGVHGIGRGHAPSQQQTRKQGLRHRDLIGFLGHEDLQQDLLALIGLEGEQMRSGVPCGNGPAHGLAVQGNGVVIRGEQGGTYPVGHGPFEMLSADTWAAASDRASRCSWHHFATATVERGGSSGAVR